MEKLLISIMNKMMQKERKRVTNHFDQKHLKLFLLGCSGVANAGSDVRVDEIVRQFNHLLGSSVDLTVSSFDLKRTRNYFSVAKQIHLKKIFPLQLYKLVQEHDGVISCESSMFQSIFSNTLSILMAGGLGLASSERKLSIGYGAEASFMEPKIEHFVQNACAESLIITRNQRSTNALEHLNIRCSTGADTAWTYDFSPTAKSYARLRKDGWDGRKKILAIVPLNSFLWPVRPSLSKFLQYKALNRFADTYYDSIYFYDYDEQDQRKFDNYIDGLAKTAIALKNKYNLFPIIIGTERVGYKAGKILAEKIGSPAPTYNTSNFDYHELFGLLASADYLISSCFYSLLLSMLKQIPSIGVGLDDRIEVLMRDRQHMDYLNHADDPNLEERLIPQFDKLLANEDEIKRNIGVLVPRYLRSLAQMGKTFLDEIQKVYPDFEIQEFDQSNWLDYLPPLSNSTMSLIDRYGGTL